MRALTISTIIMGVLIVAGTMTLIVVVARRSAGPSLASLPVSASAMLDEPSGTRIVGIATVQDRLAVLLQGGGNDRILLMDPHTGGVAGRIFLAH